MSDFEDKLNKLLNDPEEMERFAGFAKSLMSGSADEQPEPAPDIDPSMLKKISGMLSGKGGAGSRHFRREKFVEFGGPDGGDGGNGGSIVLRGNSQYWTLIHLKYQRHIFAGDGESGSGARSTGKNGADVVIATPGRMIAPLQNSGVDLSHVEYLILDAADRMLDMGFSDDIMKIIS